MLEFDLRARWTIQPSWDKRDRDRGSISGAAVPFDMQGDTEIRFRVSIRLTGTLDGSTFRGTGIRDRRRRSISGDKDGWIDSTKRITDGHKQYAGDGARTMHKTGVELWESGDGRREPAERDGTVGDRSYGAIDIQGDSGDSFPC